MRKKCATCGKEFNVKPSHYDKRTHCSRSCMALAYKNQVGDSNPNYRGVAHERTCPCGKTFLVTSSAAVGKYCSRSCAATHRDNSHLTSQAAAAARKGAAIRHEQRNRHYCVCCGEELVSRFAKYCNGCRPAPSVRGRKDDNQDQIVAGLCHAGVTVFDAHLVKNGFPDLVAINHGHPYLIEVKNPAVRSGLTPPQRRLHGAWPGQIAVAYTIEEALRIVAQPKPAVYIQIVLRSSTL